MKAKDMDIFVDDFNRVVNMSLRVSGNHYYHLRNYFFPGDHDASIPKATSASVTALRELSNFVINSWIPTTGEWIDYNLEDEKQREGAEKARRILTDRFAQSNFYREINKMFKRGVIFNNGLLSISYGSCLSFRSLEEQDIYCSSDVALENRRLYSKQQITGEDVRILYSNYSDRFELDERGKCAATTQSFTLIKGVVPNDDRFFLDSDAKKGKYVEVCWLMEEPDRLLIPKDGKLHYYRTLPSVSFGTADRTTLGVEALPELTRIEEMEMDLNEFGKRQAYPPTEVPYDAWIQGTVDLTPGGIIVRKPNDNPTQAVQTSGNMSFSYEDIARKEQKVLDIFSVNLIRQAKIQHLSQFEVAGNRLMALEATSELAETLLRQTISCVLDRAHSLLKDNDKEYRDSVKELKLKPIPITECAIIKKARKAVGVARVLQGAVPLAQIDPELAFEIDSSAGYQMLCDAYGVPELIKPSDEADQAKAAAAQQQQQALEQEQDLADAEIEAKQQQQGESQ